MSPEFAKRVDPVFAYVLNLLDRVGRGENPTPREEQTRVRRGLDAAEAALGQTDQWMLAKYALVAWVDEVLIEAPWDGRRWWEENTLEWELFQTADAYERFYDRAGKAAKLNPSNRDALEVFYVAAVLGFRGLYRDGSGAEQLGLPPDQEAWARETAQAIHLGQGRPPLAAPGRCLYGASPLESRFSFVGVALIGLILAVALSVVLWLIVTPS